MKTNNKPAKIISHISISKNKIISFAMGTTYFEVTTYFDVKDFSELTKQEKKRYSRQVNQANANTALFHKEYLRYIYLMLKSIF